jgi:hypothetical protein
MVTCQLMNNLITNNNVKKKLLLCTNFLFDVCTSFHHVQQDKDFLISNKKLNNIRSFVKYVSKDI